MFDIAIDVDVVFGLDGNIKSKLMLILIWVFILMLIFILVS